MADLIAKTICLIHPSRAAAARCPECRRFFCGECITEHDGRLTCAQCLRDEESGSRVEVKPNRLFAMAAPTLQLLIGVILIWALFYFVARFLMMVPATFHDGTVWEE
ncbi:MAG: rhomboid family protein [Verrucomicrobiota bacterium]